MRPQGYTDGNGDRWEYMRIECSNEPKCPNSQDRGVLVAVKLYKDPYGNSTDFCMVDEDLTCTLCGSDAEPQGLART